MDRTLLIIVYLNDIDVFSNLWEYVLSDTIEVIKKSTTAGFMIILKKSQLVKTLARILHNMVIQGLLGTLYQ